MVWMRLNQALFGFKPWGWHLTTVAMHVLATFFVFRLARKLAAISAGDAPGGTADEVGLITALIFGLHPVHIEAVAWVSGVTESLFAILLIWSFLCFLDWRENRPNARTYSLLLYALAILSKETAVLMMPLVAAFVWLYPDKEHLALLKRFWDSLRAAIPYLGVTLIYLYLRWLALSGLFHAITPLPLLTKLLTIPSVLWFYLKMLFVPVGLGAFYDTPYVTSASLHQFWLPLLGVGLFAGALFYWWWKTRDRLVAFAAVILIVPLAPLMNFSVFFTGEIAHDRYLYTPSIGFAILVALGIVLLTRKLTTAEARTRAVWAIVAPIALLCLGLTIYQSLFWADNLVLYNRAVKTAPNNNLALDNLANEFGRRNMYPQAITLYGKVLERDPTFYFANYNMGYTAYASGDWTTGEHFLRRAAALDPTDAGTFYYLGKCEMQLGKLDEAEANLHRAIIVDQRLLGPRYTLGVLLKQEGRNKEALDYFRAELAKNPNDADARKQEEELEGK
jgi:protein O-mannosyl-transferase